MGECLGQLCTGSNGKLPAILRCAIAQSQSPNTFPYKLHNFELLPRENLAKYHDKALL